MPAYSQHHQHHAMSVAMAVCPHCNRLALQMRDVEPHWSAARLVVVFECPECCTEVRETVTKQ
jgi:hypothetical protein